MALQVELRHARGTTDFARILALQANSLRQNVSAEVAKTEGFLSVEHSVELLETLNEPIGHSVAIDAQTLTLLGYALSMPSVYRAAIPKLTPMFAQFDELRCQGQPVRDLPYVVMGQICVAPNARCKGIFRQLYDHWFESHSQRFKLALTEVEASNTRSLGAHLAVGFEELIRYRQDDWHWVVIAKQIG